MFELREATAHQDVKSLQEQLLQMRNDLRLAQNDKRGWGKERGELLADLHKLERMVYGYNRSGTRTVLSTPPKAASKPKLKKKKKRSSASAASKSLLHSLRTGKSVRGSGRGRGTRR